MMSFANGQKSLLKWCVVINFPTVPEVQTMVDIHETSGIPILLSLPRIPDTVELTCPSVMEFNNSRHL
eukprot:12891312-Prorocentrum_lima.AAC.1